MADSRYGSPEGQDSVQGENNHHFLESTLARMANYFERQEGRIDKIDRTLTEVSDDVAFERF